MNWIYFALGSIISFALADTLSKLVSSKMNIFVSTFIINLVSGLALLVFIIPMLLKDKSVFNMSKEGLFLSLGAGIAVASATLFFMKLFSTGTNLSIASPSVRIGTLLLVSLIGVIFLKEGISLKYIAGIILSLVGLYLLTTSQ